MSYLKKLDIKLVDGEFKNPLKDQVRSPDDIHKIFWSIKDRAVETAIGVYLSDELVGAWDVLSLGSRSETLLDIDDTLGRGWALRARYVILVHNHPSGDPTPTDDDMDVVRHLIEATKWTRLKLLDFIVIGGEEYWSYFNREDVGDADYRLGTPFV